jgi:mevalonate kinase
MEMAVEATAPGKAILFGEHSVVYRGPAIVIAIDKRARIVAESREDSRIYFDALDLGFSGYFEGTRYFPVRGKSWHGKRLRAILVTAHRTMEHIGVHTGLDIKVRSEIPVASGLGSSAAIFVSTAAAIGEVLGANLSLEEICNLALEGEKVVHGTPSGVDNSISTYGGALRYERDLGFDKIEPLGTFYFVLGNSKRRRSTKRLVLRVRSLYERHPKIIERVIETIAKTSDMGLDAMKKGDLPYLGELMNINHGLLAAIGVSITKLDSMVHASRVAGAYGAKLTGAGGGGCIIALTDSTHIDWINNAIRKCGGEPFPVNISKEGVKTRRIER